MTKSLPVNFSKYDILPYNIEIVDYCDVTSIYRIYIYRRMLSSAGVLLVKEHISLIHVMLRSLQRLQKMFFEFSWHLSSLTVLIYC